MKASPQLESALRAADRGWQVFPVQECAKRPLVKWQTEATTDPARLRRWWSGPWERANVGCVVPAGMVVLDVDRRHDGDATLEELEAKHGLLPRTLTCVTGSGGLHLWFAVNDPDGLRQDAGVLGPGVDSRCAGRGYLVVPPSVHPCGGTYEWARGDKRVVPAPAWLVERLRRPPHQTVMALPAPDRPMAGTYGQKALRSELDRLAAATVGHRNKGLHLAAVRVGQLVAAGHVSEAEAAAALADTARRVGLDDREVAATVRSGLSFGIANPRLA